MTEQGKVVASRDGYRLVHSQRDPASWPNVSDLTLEQLSHDAMREPRWVYVYSWCLSPQTDPYKNVATVAFKMLLDTGAVVTK